MRKLRKRGNSAYSSIESFLTSRPSVTRFWLLVFGALGLGSFTLYQNFGSDRPLEQDMELLVFAALLGVGAMIELERLLSGKRRARRGGPDKEGHLPRIDPRA